MKNTRTEILKEIEELNEKRLRGMITRYRYYKEYERIKAELLRVKND